MSQATTTVHGGLIYEHAHQLQWSDLLAQQRVLDFSASISPITPVIDWQALQQAAQHAIQHYPDQSAKTLKTALQRRFSIATDYIQLSNGISSAIMQFFAQLSPDQTLLFTPIYSEYERAAEQYSQCVTRINLFQQPERISDNNTLSQIQSLPANSVVVLVNPSTPDGHCFSLPQLQQLLDAIHKHQCWCLLDESFLPFVSFKSSDSGRSLLALFPQLIILQSLTKYFACPGIRIGALFLSPFAQTHFLWPAWPISILDQIYLEQALKDKNLDTQTQQFLTTNKANFIKALSQLPWVETVYPSSANFVLIKSKLPAETIVKQLAKQHILLRDCSSFGLEKFYLRLAIKSHTDNQTLLTEFNKFKTLTTQPEKTN